MNLSLSFLKTRIIRLKILNYLSSKLFDPNKLNRIKTFFKETIHERKKTLFYQLLCQMSVSS